MTPVGREVREDRGEGILKQRRDSGLLLWGEGGQGRGNIEETQGFGMPAHGRGR
jgi:hypothetical protein